jgi:hypothetical protein
MEEADKHTELIMAAEFAQNTQKCISVSCLFVLARRGLGEGGFIRGFKSNK